MIFLDTAFQEVLPIIRTTLVKTLESSRFKLFIQQYITINLNDREIKRSLALHKTCYIILPDIPLLIVLKFLKYFFHMF